MSAPRILAIAGSLRAGSYNRRVLQVAIRAAKEAGAEVTHADLRDYRLPVYDADLESAEGLPGAALKLKALFRKNDGLLFACPEHNSTITATLKNTFDWVSRKGPDEDAGVLAFRGKVAGLIAASPGALGGLRGLAHVRACLNAMNTLVLPEQAAVPKVTDILTEDDDLSDDTRRGQVQKVARRLVEVTGRLFG